MSKTTLMKTGHTIQLPEGMTMKQTADNQWEVVPVEKKLPRKWEDLGAVGGGYVTTHSIISGDPDSFKAVDCNKNVWPTKELAEASLAMSQLMQLHKAWTGGKTGPVLVRTINRRLMQPLAFKTIVMCNDFQETFKDLIEQASALYE